jgi:phosphoglycolate phosphatase-like HAD superfamily hydrolase
MERSFILGDSWVDMAAGRRAGIGTVFIGDYKCDTCSMMNGSKPDMAFATVRDFSGHLSAANGKAER